MQGGDVLLEGVCIAGLIGGGGVRLVENFAQVDEVRLCGGAFGERAGFPAGDKLRQSEWHSDLWNW
jgi:hypothetical protein